MSRSSAIALTVLAAVITGSGACHTRRESSSAASASQAVRAEWLQADSMRLHEAGRILRHRRIEWNVFHLSPPDSLGRQHPTRIAIGREQAGEQLAGQRTQTAIARTSGTISSHTDTQSKQRQEVKSRPSYLPAVWLALGIAFFVWLRRRG